MRIVAFLFRRVGDSFMAQPALRALKQQWPAARLEVIAEPGAARVFGGLSYVDMIHAVNAPVVTFPLLRAIRGRGTPDVLLDFMANPRTALVSLLSGAGRRVGIGHRGRGWVYTDCVEIQNRAAPVYSALHKLGLAAKLGAVAADWRTEFALGESDEAIAEREFATHGWSPQTPVVAFFVHSRREYKRWPCERYAEVIAELKRARLVTPLVLSTPGDEESVAAVAARAGLSDHEVLRVSDLGQLGSVLKRCALYVGNDGGPKHVAVAVGTRTLTLFGTEPPEYWTPPDAARHGALTAHTGNPARETLAGITVRQVLDGIRQMMQGN